MDGKQPIVAHLCTFGLCLVRGNDHVGQHKEWAILLKHLKACVFKLYRKYHSSLLKKAQMAWTLSHFLC